MLWGVLIGGLALIVFLVLAGSSMYDASLKARAERDAANREHELALADREVEMWKATKASFSEAMGGRRGIPRLVGRSQVIPSGYPVFADDRMARVAERSQEITETGTTESHLRSGIPEQPPEPSLRVGPSHHVDAGAALEIWSCDRSARKEPHGPHRWTMVTFDGPPAEVVWCEGIREDPK